MLRQSIGKTPNLKLLVRDDTRRVELERILQDPASEAARHVVSRESAANGHQGLPLLDDVTDYPEAVLNLHRAATSDVALLHIVEALLFTRGEEQAAATARILVRELARRDKVELMFSLLHVMRQRGVQRDRLLYRSLMFACCKYDDLDWGLYALEQMFHDGIVDVPSMVRLFDSHTANANRRAWHVLDVILLCAPGINPLARWNLATAAILNAVAHAFNLGRSVRARRGFISLPNPRGEHANPWRYTVEGMQTYLEVDARSGHFEVPAAYSPEQLELRDSMLELEDGARIKHWQLGTQSNSMIAGAALLREAVETRQLNGEFADFMLQRMGDDATRPDGLMGIAPTPRPILEEGNGRKVRAIEAKE